MPGHNYYESKVEAKAAEVAMEEMAAEMKEKVMEKVMEVMVGLRREVVREREEEVTAAVEEVGAAGAPHYPCAREYRKSRACWQEL